LFRRTWQSPSNAHAYRLYVFNEPGIVFGRFGLLALPDSLRSAKPWIMTVFMKTCQTLGFLPICFASRFVYRFASLRFQQSLEFYTSFFRLVNSRIVFLNPFSVAAGASNRFRFSLRRHQQSPRL
jgi:hypothetical protein